MTRKSCFLSLLSVVFAVFHSLTWAQDVEIENAYVRALIPGRDVTAAFMSITNNSECDCELVAAETPIARAVEIHSHRHEQGMMRMRREDSITIAAGEQVVFESGGLHFMLFGVEQPLMLDQNYPLVLIFEGCERQALSMSVRELR